MFMFIEASLFINFLEICNKILVFKFQGNIWTQQKSLRNMLYQKGLHIKVFKRYE